MLGLHSFPPYPETRFASTDRKPAVSAGHAPRQNRLLAALPPEDYERLLPNLEPVPLPLGWTVHRAGDREQYLLSLIHISEPTRLGMISYAVFCLKKKKD